MVARLDHIAVAANDLSQGVAWVSEQLGVEVPAGGVHPRMGTHNHLLSLGNDAIYLEIIAIDPTAPHPGRPRWFGLDDPETQAMLRERPRLVTWLARSDDIEADAARSVVPLGKVEHMTRGSLEWDITVPEDGRLPCDGLVPMLLQWPADRPHPATAMPDLGVRLLGLELRGPDPDRLKAALAAMNLDLSAGPVTVVPQPGPVRLEARLDTPRGVVTLS